MDFMAFMESMGTSDIAIIAAFFIGLMTAISPCPMATNITAIAFISKKIDNGKHTLITGFIYTAGRMFTYVALASLIVYLGLNVQAISFFLQKYGERSLGPLLIFIGLTMLNVIKLNFVRNSTRLDSLKEKLSQKGYFGAFSLGVIFALAFCPFSAVLFFGMLIPLALKFGDGILIPSVFAFATGLPVILFSLILVYSVSKLGSIMNKVQAFEKYMRYVVSIIFLLVGVYYTILIWGFKMIITDLFFAGIAALTEYLSAHVLTCLIPAFFIAGAIAVFLKKEYVLKYLGPKTKKHISFSVAAVSGCILAVCSCTILPLFAGIKKRGAGLGPAITFLFSGPAINLLAIIYTAQVLGFDLGVARAIAAISLSIIIGLIMHFLFQRRAVEDVGAFSNPISEPQKSKTTTLSFFALLIGILIINGLQIAFNLKLILIGLSIVLLLILLKLKFTKKETIDWMKETWAITKLITPYLILGVFIAGIISFLLPEEIVRSYLGGNSLTSNFVASVFGAFMYFATLTEVPIIGELMKMGMGKGPALALLLAGPSLSLPNMLVIRKVLGNKQTIVYICLVIIFSTTAGFIYGGI